MTEKTIHIQYFALLREERGLDTETLRTTCQTAKEFYEELKTRHQFSLSKDLLRVSINNTLQDWDQTITDNDKIVFIPPVAGG